MTKDLLRKRLATSAAMLAVFDDSSTLRHALEFEAALARSKAAQGLITEECAERIAGICATLDIPPDALADEAAHAGTLAIALVARLRAALDDDAEAAAEVHRGSTSQDLADTILVLQASEALALITADLKRLSAGLVALCERYGATPVVGRTLLQNALPLTFGLRSAQWLAGLDDARGHLESAAAEAIVLQFGGAVGTRAGLGGMGAEIADHMAKLLGLRAPIAPWHGRRANIAALAAALAVLIGAIGKIARDISLLSQGEIGEVSEPEVAGRGGSSAMPHKRNPLACQVALSAAAQAPGLLAGIVGALPQELERGLGGWQAEPPALASLLMLAGGSANAMADAIEGLQVDVAAMERNLAASGVGSDTGEAEGIVAAILARHQGRD